MVDEFLLTLWKIIPKIDIWHPDKKLSSLIGRPASTFWGISLPGRAISREDPSKFAAILPKGSLFRDEASIRPRPPDAKEGTRKFRVSREDGLVFETLIGLRPE